MLSSPLPFPLPPPSTVPHHLYTEGALTGSFGRADTDVPLVLRGF